MIRQDIRKIYKKYIKLYNKADRCLNNQQYMQAIECYRKAIKINPNSDEAYCNMGISFENLKQYKDAIKCYDKGVNSGRKMIQILNMHRLENDSIIKKLSDI